MQTARSRVLWTCIGLVLFPSLWIAGARAQNFPSKPIRLVVGFSPGGSSDVSARLVAQKLTEELGQPVIVENRIGAAGYLSIERVATSPADGYTLVHIAASAAVQPALHPKLTYNLERDLTPVSLVVILPYLLVVHPSVPAHNVKELIALARLQPGKLAFGSDGVGSALHFAGELFNTMAKVTIRHVPYKGGVGSVIATATGEVDISYPSITSAQPLLETKKVRPLAVTSTKRSSIMPSVPTLNEAGVPGYDRPGWNGTLAPAGIPKDILARLNTAIAKVVNTAEMKKAFAAIGLEAQTNTPEQFAAFIRHEVEQNIKLVKSSGLKSE